MELARTVFIGVDIVSGRRGFTYAAFGLERQLLALCQGDLKEIAAFTAGQSAAFAAIATPQAPNKGLLANPAPQEGLFPLPEVRPAPMRCAEQELMQRGMVTTKTPGSVDACPAWMRQGFELYRHLISLGYQPYPSEDAPRQYLETPPEAVFASLLGVAPFPAGTLESRLQRQLVLYEHNLPVKDSMHFLEEVTRHRLLKSILPLEHIHTCAELNAMSLAYTAWLAATQPTQVIRLGDPHEGEIVLPTTKTAVLHG
ncbi:MAG TPA: hypothetical protein VLH85_09235 [Levilinea sp.]|nr:hypothetical protein [Levilinea sp.]